jgi:hypothetical protein
VASLLAAPRSLLVFTGDAYEQCLHGIEEVRPKQRVLAARGALLVCVKQLEIPCSGVIA